MALRKPRSRPPDRACHHSGQSVQIARLEGPDFLSSARLACPVGIAENSPPDCNEVEFSSGEAMQEQLDIVDRRGLLAGIVHALVDPDPTDSHRGLAGDLL